MLTFLIILHLRMIIFLQVDAKLVIDCCGLLNINNAFNTYNGAAWLSYGAAWLSW